MVDFNKSTKEIFLAKCLLDCIEDEDIRNIKTLLVEKNADPNIIIPDEGASVFHLLISENKNEDFILKIIQLFLKNGGDPNVRSETGLTPLHVAAGTGKIRVLYLLVLYNGDILAKDDYGKMPIDYAQGEEKWRAVTVIEKLKVFRERGIDLESYLRNEYYSILQLEDTANISNCKKSLSCPSSDPVLIINDTPLSKTNIVNSRSNKTLNLNLNNDKQMTNLILILTPDSNSSLASTNKSIETSYESCDSTVTYKETKTCNENGISCFINSEINSLLNKTTTVSYIISDLQSIVDNRHKYMISPILPSNSNCNYTINNQSTKNVSILKPEYFTPKTQLNPLLDETSKSLISTMSTLDIQNDCTSELVNSNSSNYSILSPIEPPSANKSKIKFAVTEEYNHMDHEEGIKLTERRHLVKPFELPLNESGISPLMSDDSNEMTFALDTDYDTDTLRNNLTTMGFKPGPITKTTKKVYLKKLVDLWENCEIQIVPAKTNKVYTLELEKTFKNPNWISNLDQYVQLEKQIENHFENTKTKWRGGNSKSSFTYLLLDPRITQNLPLRAKFLKPSDLWKVFIDSIFYVGKGKRARPYAHLYQAVNIWNKQELNLKKSNKKIQHILDIWKEQYGVICLHIFQNIIPVEAHTREAAMIEVLGLNNLKNIKSGEYYGITMKWRKRDKCMLGVYLLYKALQIFLNEGERQLRPADID